MVTVNQVLLLKKAFSDKAALGGPFIPTYFKEHGLSRQYASLLLFVQLHTNNAVPSLSAMGHTHTHTLGVLFGCVASPKLASCCSFFVFLLLFFLPDTWWCLWMDQREYSDIEDTQHDCAWRQQSLLDISYILP